jgi:hypothetical protein
MTTLEAIPTTIQRPEADAPFDEAHLAAARVPCAPRRPSSGGLPARPARIHSVGER